MKGNRNVILSWEQIEAWLKACEACIYCETPREGFGRCAFCGAPMPELVDSQKEKTNDR